MRQLRTALFITALASAWAPVTLRGQAAEPAPFHRRQWGADFEIGAGFVGAGLIHFSAPNRAVVLDLTAAASTETATGTLAGTTGNSSDLVLSLGARRYRPIAARVLALMTLGVDASYKHIFAASAAQPTDNTWAAGLFGDAGASWLVTPHLGLGAAWRLNLSYFHEKASGRGPTGTASGIQLSLNQVRLTGQLYF